MTLEEDLDDLIEEITVDCYDDGEALSGFACAFDEDVHFPINGHVVGQPVEVLSIGLGDGRRELVAKCARADRHYCIALLDVEIDDDAASRLVAAYVRWLGP